MDFQSLLHSVQSRQPFGCLDGPSGLTGKVYRFRPAPTISVLLIERPHIAGRVYLTGKLSAARTSGEPRAPDAGGHTHAAVLHRLLSHEEPACPLRKPPIRPPLPPQEMKS